MRHGVAREAGVTLLLLHGSGATPDVWDRVREHLFGLPVLAPAFPGRAGAVWPVAEDERGVAAYGRAVVAAMDRSGVDAAVVAGHSLGGAVALWLALEHPSRVAGLGLVCSGARLRVMPQVLEGLHDGIRDAMDLFANAQCGPRATDRERIVLRRQLETVGMDQTLQDLKACNAFDVMERLGEIDRRAVVLGARDDVLTPPKYSIYLADRIPAARLVLYDDAGHALHVERPEDVAGELAVLWASSAPRAARASGGREAGRRSWSAPGTTGRSAGSARG